MSIVTKNRLLQNICKQIASKRSLSTTVVTLNKWNPVIYSRNLDLGRSVFESHATRTIVDRYPHMTVNQINDTVQGLAYNDLIHSTLPDNDVLKSSTNTEDILAKLGSLKLRNDNVNLNEILCYIDDHCLSNLSHDMISKCIKLQHPKALLQSIANELECSVVLNTVKVSDDLYESELNVTSVEGESIKYLERYSTSIEAERLVCISCLYGQLFGEKFKQINISDISFPLEEDVYLGPIDCHQRTVTLSKGDGESFGFTIRGGEQKIIKNKEYVQLHTISPVFISDIIKESPAEKCGLKVGDVILSVNDHVVKDLTHKQAVLTLKKFLNHSKIDFVVSYEKMEVLKYEAEQNILERQKEKLKEEINRSNLSKWHHSRAKENPDEYFKEIVEDKKRPFQPKKGRKAIRLWEIRPKKYTN